MDVVLQAAIFRLKRSLHICGIFCAYSNELYDYDCKLALSIQSINDTPKESATEAAGAKSADGKWDNGYKWKRAHDEAEAGMNATIITV